MTNPIDTRGVAEANREYLLFTPDNEVYSCRRTKSGFERSERVTDRIRQTRYELTDKAKETLGKPE